MTPLPTGETALERQIRISRAAAAGSPKKPSLPEPVRSCF